MSRRIIIDDVTENEQDDEIIPRITSRAGSGGSIRRLRTSHYWGQRASTDALPLIPFSQRPARSRPTRNSFPAPPPPTYQPQPHQLIAVCFNHMAGRRCEHCQQLNGQYAGRDRDEESPDSANTLGHQQQQRHSSHGDSDLGENEKAKDGGEQGGQQGPPSPVGVWDKRLSKLRVQVFGLWARTSQLASARTAKMHSLIVRSFDPVHLHSRGVEHVLGGSIQC